MHAHARTHTHARTHAHTHTHIYDSAYARTHVRARAHTHTHPHTHNDRLSDNSENWCFRRVVITIDFVFTGVMSM